VATPALPNIWDTYVTSYTLIPFEL